MSLRKRFVLGDKTAGRTIDTTTNATVYTNRIALEGASVWSAHFVWTGTPTSTITLWASNHEEPSVADDTDWVQMTAAHGYGGLPGGDPAGSASKDMVHLSGFGAAWARFKIVTSVSSGTISCRVSAKDSA